MGGTRKGKKSDVKSVSLEWPSRSRPHVACVIIRRFFLLLDRLPDRWQVRTPPFDFVEASFREKGVRSHMALTEKGLKDSGLGRMRVLCQIRDEYRTGIWAPLSKKRYLSLCAPVLSRQS